jgi:farnesyl-diphosphate farnesyltransferase
MLQVFLDSITKPAELQALYKYKFATKSASAQRLEQTLAKDAPKRQCYHYLNLASQMNIFLCIGAPSFINFAWNLDFS